jgi:hypothetical protein
MSADPEQLDLADELARQQRPTIEQLRAAALDDRPWMDDVDQAEEDDDDDQDDDGPDGAA